MVALRRCQWRGASRAVKWSKSIASTGRNACASGPAACIISSVIACWISVPLILSIDTSAPGGRPLRRIWSRKRRLVISSAISSTSTRVSRSRKRGSSMIGRPSFICSRALALLVHEVLGRHLDLVEEDLVDLLAAVEQDDRPDRDARGLHVDQKERDAVLALAAAVRAHQAEDPVRVLGHGRPDLLAGDHVVAVLPHRPRLERRQVRARARLRVALAPEILSLVDAREELLLLGVGAELQEHRGAHAHAE